MNPELEKARIRTGRFASSEKDGFNGFFELFVNGEQLRVIASDGFGWQHVSVSKAGRPDKVPNWDQMNRIKDLFWTKDEWACQFHPAQCEYINNHPGCLHLWRLTRERLPTPPAELTGLKGKTPADMKKMSREEVSRIYAAANDPARTFLEKP